MNRKLILGLAFAVFCFLEWSPAERAATVAPAAARPTLAPAGPFHVSGNQIIDSEGRPFVIRGTQIAAFHLDTVARDNRAGLDYGPHSATTLSAIRLRFNLNAVRIPVDLRESTRPGYFAALARVVRRANEMDLLAILDGRGEPSATPEAVDFWKRCAAYFKGYPNVMFGALSDSAGPESAKDVVHAIRGAGASQVVIVTEAAAGAAPDDSNLVYEARLRPAAHGAAPLAARTVPVLANGLDPELDNAPECANFPADPAAAGALVEDYLNYFDAHAISWTVSSFEPGKLIRDFSLHDATSLENGWTCGKPDPGTPAGIGRIIQAHMRGSVERELFVVSGAGGLDIARGAFALAYGPVMADHDAEAGGSHPPLKLGGISVQVTDALGVTRPAGVFWASEGWGQTNFVIPDQSAVGPARMTVRREDGSTTSTNISIADTAPGFVTGHSCRGPAMGSATQTFADGRTVTTKISSCKGFDCRTIAIPVAAGATTRVRIFASGYRHARSAAEIDMRIGGVRVPVVSFGPTENPGQDQVTVEIPAQLYGVGETDMICHLNGRISNATRIRIGAAKPVS
ncbi:MAG TPA: hypothetical protein VN841_03125 [Bryobacteraceae bacterium]|nr:hypothetical protein [Bryobacteraceae bacterium]